MRKRALPPGGIVGGGNLGVTVSMSVSDISSGGGAVPISSVLIVASGLGAAPLDETMVSGKPLQAVIVRMIKSNHIIPLMRLCMQHLLAR
jgi:hypothetical protein